MATKKQLEAAKLLHEALNGDRKAAFTLSEGISTSDLPVQLSPALTAIMLSNYAEQPKIWGEFATRHILPDFETQNYWQLMPWGDEDIERETGGVRFMDGGLPNIPEYDEYPRIRFEATEQQLRGRKSGVAVQFSWELLKNPSRINLIQQAFSEFGRRAAVAEDHEATKMLVSTENFSTANGNIATGDAAGPLSLPVLEAAFQQIAEQQYNGRRVTVPTNYKLVVSSANVLTARQIQAITDIEMVQTSNGVETRTRTGNPVASRFTIVENPYLLQAGANEADWYLIPTPGSTPNPNVLVTFVQGEETPKVFVKRTTASAPEEGSFENDDYETKVRTTATGGFLRPEGTLAYRA